MAIRRVATCELAINLSWKLVPSTPFSTQRQVYCPHFLLCLPNKRQHIPRSTARPRPLIVHRNIFQLLGSDCHLLNFGSYIPRLLGAAFTTTSLASTQTSKHWTFVSGRHPSPTPTSSPDPKIGTQRSRGSPGHQTFPMPTSKAHQRSYTINIRASGLAPPQQHPGSRPHRSSHNPSKSTPNALAMMSAETLPSLAAAATLIATPDHLPRHNRELTLRRYLLLQEEHEAIRHHLDELSACSTPASTSPVTSPVRPYRQHQRSHSGSRPAPSRRVRTSGCGAQPMILGDNMVALDNESVVDPAAMAEMASEEARLFTINEGIKRSLTELLNCETVRSDQAFRQWIMGRLMEVEKELRVGRRRRSS